ncbi:MAG: hypothetical protein IPM31_17180 [Anaerolineae bacterium]|nr:hypothetical protein [Anaerolineae bacterium]
MKKLEQEDVPRLEKYEEQERILAGRNSYSKPTRSQQSGMKEDGGAQAAGRRL